MKILSLTQPWAQLVVEGFKKYETRSWRTGYRGLMAIHAAKSFPRDAKQLLCEDGPFSEALNRPPEELLTGAILGVVDLRGCFSANHELSIPDEPERSFGDYSPDRWVWELINPVIIAPIPASGKLGLWMNAGLELIILRHYYQACAWRFAERPIPWRTYSNNILL
jgi:hypothetical protein